MTQVSGFELTSTRTVGVHTNNTNKSAMLKFVRKMFVEFRMSLVRMITMGTWHKEDGRRKKLFLTSKNFKKDFSFHMYAPVNLNEWINLTTSIKWKKHTHDEWT